MRILRTLIACSLVLAPALAGAEAGRDPMRFLFLNSDARVVAMGGAYSALATNTNAVRLNPAGLGGRRYNEATFMHNQYFQGVTQDHTRAVSLYQQACDGGHMSGCSNLGVMYETGEGVTQDLSRAASLYEQACDGGLVAACQEE